MTNRTCLLIDDDLDDLEFLEEAVNSADASLICHSFESPIIALNQLKINAIPDFIFLDLNMPILNGKQLLKEIKSIKKLAKITIIIYSTSSSQIDIQEIKALGANNFFVKPSKFSFLIEQLKTIFLHTTKSFLIQEPGI